MLQPCHRLGLDPETSELPFPGVLTTKDHFEGDEAFELQLPGFVDDAHAAATQLTQDLVAWQRRDCLAVSGFYQFGEDGRAVPSDFIGGRDGGWGKRNRWLERRFADRDRSANRADEMAVHERRSVVEVVFPDVTAGTPYRIRHQLTSLEP